MNTWYLITFDCPCNLKTISSSSQYRYRTPLQSACVISLQCHVKSSFIKMQQRCVSFGKTVQNLAEKPWFQSCLTLVLMSGCYYSFPKTVIGLFTSLIGLMFQISKIFTRVWRLLREKMHSIIDQFGQLQDWVSTHSNWISLPTSIIRVHFFQKKVGLSRLLLSRLGALAPLVSSTSSLRGHHRLHQKNTSLEFSPSIVPWSSNLSSALLSYLILRLELSGLWSFKQKWHWCQY